jgi:hypothetical protein
MANYRGKKSKQAQYISRRQKGQSPDEARSRSYLSRSAAWKAEQAYQEQAKPISEPAAVEDHETDPDLIRIWNNALCREAAGIISDTRHPLHGQPAPEGAYADALRRQETGDCPGWVAAAVRGPGADQEED